MAGLLNNSFCIAGFNNGVLPRSSGSSADICSLRFKESNPREAPFLFTNFKGKQLIVSQDSGDRRSRAPGNHLSVHASICVAPALRWWNKTLKPNMVEINSTMDLVTSLLTAEDKLVVVVFYSPGCGGCRTLHPKICQIAELHEDAIFLKVNYDELRTMCKCLNVHVLPFFKFYRGAQGRVCSFSCTNATIKKFKDAMAKHGTDRCSIGPTKGLDEAELQRLVSSGELSMDWSLAGSKNKVMDDMGLASLGVAEARNRALEKMATPTPEEDSLVV